MLTGRLKGFRHQSCTARIKETIILRRPFSKFAAIGALCALAVGACGSSASSAQQPAGSRTSAEAASGGTLTIGISSLPASDGNPFGETYAGLAVEIWPSIFDALTTIGKSYQAAPALATSWKLVSPDTWRFYLRKGVKFQDGEAFNASAVAATFNYLTSKAGQASGIGGSYPQLKSATVINQSTVDINTKTPDPILPKELDQVNIVAPQAWQRLGAKGFATHPVGTGPYKVTSWGPTEVTLTRYTGSWRKANYKELRFVAIPDNTARYQALVSGQIQVDYDLTLEQLQTAQSSGNLYLIKGSGATVFSIQYLDKKGSPLLNSKVRVALNEAVNRPEIIKDIFHNVATAAYQGGSPGIAGYDPKLPPIKYNPTDAKKLLAEAGYPHGFSFQADVSVGVIPGDTESVEAAQAQLAQIGVHMTVIQDTFTQWVNDFLTAGFPGEATSIGFSSTPQFDAALPLSRSSCLEKPAVLWCVPSQATVISKILSNQNPVSRTQEFDQLAEMQRTNPPALWLFNRVNATGVARSVKAAYTPIGSLNFDTVAPSS